MSKNIKLALIALITAILGTGFYFTPHLTVYNMGKAAENNDVDAFSSYIDYPSLRESFKAWINTRMAVMIGKNDNPYATLGAAFASIMINPMVEALITPESISMMMKGEKPNFDEPGTGAKRKAEVKESDLEISRSYKDFNHFAVKLKKRSTSEDQFEWIFKRDGLISWKLSAMRMPGLDRLYSQPSQSNADTSTQYQGSSPTQHEPLQDVHKSNQLLETVELIDVSNSDNLVKIILQYDKIEPEYSKNFKIARFDINNDGEKDILYTCEGWSGSGGYSWEILINKGGGKFEKSKLCIPSTGLILDFSSETVKGMKIPYFMGDKLEYQ